MEWCVKFTSAALDGVVIIEPKVFVDERGWFMESFNERCFQEGLSGLGLPVPKAFVQDNQSSSKKGVLRGLHYQLGPHTQGKLVCVTQGLHSMLQSTSEWVRQRLVSGTVLNCLQ